MAADAAYALTRREGSPGTVTRKTGETSKDPETGDVVEVTTVTSLQWVVKEPTSYVRIVRSQATKQDVGGTTFTLWADDVSFVKVDPDDYLTFGGVDYQVRSSSIERKAFVITADEVV